MSTCSASARLKCAVSEFRVVQARTLPPLLSPFSRSRARRNRAKGDPNDTISDRNCHISPVFGSGDLEGKRAVQGTYVLQEL
ncbi:unnamed protein product [Chondrus crispus]|uniref:Uncharacterized protein n=1 Tax=Chondrus crispus TaxID=2769 RepID=R7QFI4_CHOCR|nr:unnamed protein product [Chondrus crispus]CDF36493.1 unnamed protein product [Chondrus crispus]|eukprot:XP_005716312.1 unnamed protein product [Chondrus crispus]